MKELKFRTLENLNVPDELMDLLLAIPETESEKPPVPLWRRPRFIAMAASLVLVTALSLSLFLTMGSKPPISVKSDSKYDSTQIVWSTDEHGATVATEVIVVPDAQSEDQSTEHKSGITRFFENLFGITDPTTPPSGSDPSDRGRISPTAKPGGSGGKSAPTEKRSPYEGGGSSVTPTDPPHDDPKPIDDPTEEPWVYPTELQWHDPTEAPWENPTEPTWEFPTESPSVVESTIHAWLPVSVIPEDEKIYCKVISLKTGKLYGDYGEYDESRQMSCTYKGSEYWYYSYNCRQYFEIPKVFQADEVVFYVYDSEGTVLYSDTTYLGSWV